MAELFGAELHVLLVAKDSCDIAIKHGVTGTFEGTKADDESANWLGQILGETGTIRRVDAVQVGHDVAERITKYVQAHNIDLIVMATHGRGGLAHVWLGSITEKVIRSAPARCWHFGRLRRVHAKANFGPVDRHHHNSNVSRDHNLFTNPSTQH